MEKYFDGFFSSCQSYTLRSLGLVRNISSSFTSWVQLLSSTFCTMSSEGGTVYEGPRERFTGECMKMDYL